MTTCRSGHGYPVEAGAGIAALPRSAAGGSPWPDGGAPAAIAARPPVPVVVIPGTECRTGHEEVIGDYLTAVLPADRRAWAFEFLQSWYGAECRLASGAARRCKSRWVYPSGASVFVDHQGDGGDMVIIDLPGGAISWAGGFIDLVKELAAAGARFTRVDLAIDVRGRVRLTEAVALACERGELVGSRRAHVITGLRSGVRQVETVYLGRRGSPRFGRVYDKGVESGTAAYGEWQRYEVEFKSDAADQVAQCLLAVGRCEVKVFASVSGRDKAFEILDRWESQALSFILGAFDFRESNGQRKSRRPRASWWASFVGSLCVQTVTPRRFLSPEAGRWLRWCFRAVGGKFARIADECGMSPGEVLDRLSECGGLLRVGTGDLVVKQLVTRLKE